MVLLCFWFLHDYRRRSLAARPRSMQPACGRLLVVFFFLCALRPATASSFRFLPRPDVPSSFVECSEPATGILPPPLRRSSQSIRRGLACFPYLKEPSDPVPLRSALFECRSGRASFSFFLIPVQKRDSHWHCHALRLVSSLLVLLIQSLPHCPF